MPSDKYTSPTRVKRGGDEEQLELVKVPIVNCTHPSELNYTEQVGHDLYSVLSSTLTVHYILISLYLDNILGGAKGAQHTTCDACLYPCHVLL